MGVFDAVGTTLSGGVKGVARGGLKGFIAGLLLSGIAMTAAAIATFLVASTILPILGVSAGLTTLASYALAGSAGIGTGVITGGTVSTLTSFGAAVGSFFGIGREFKEERQRTAMREDTLEEAKKRILQRGENIERQLHELHQHAMQQQHGHDGGGAMSHEQLVAENAALRAQIMQQAKGMGNYGTQQQGRGTGSPLDPEYYRSGRGTPAASHA